MAAIVVKQDNGKTEAEQHFADVAEALDAAHVQRAAIKTVVSGLTSLDEAGRQGVEADLSKYATMLREIETTIAEIRADYRDAQEAMQNDPETQAINEAVEAEAKRLRVAFLTAAIGEEGEVTYFGPQSNVRVRGTFVSVDAEKGTLVMEQMVATSPWSSFRCNFKKRKRTIAIDKIDRAAYRGETAWISQSQYSWLEWAQQKVRAAR